MGCKINADYLEWLAQSLTLQLLNQEDEQAPVMTSQKHLNFSSLVLENFSQTQLIHYRQSHRSNLSFLTLAGVVFLDSQANIWRPIFKGLCSLSIIASDYY